MDDEKGLIIYNTPDGRSKVALMARDGMVWLNQQSIAELFGTSKQNVSWHISNILKDGELAYDSVVKDYLTTAADGKPYHVMFYSLPMIIAIGYKVKGVRGADGRPDYFDELLLRIRDIRASEKRFYQKIRDLFALSSDYDKSDKATQMFFAETQNKLLYAVTHHTAAELVYHRADSQKPNMGLTTWKGSIVRKGDIIIAKNYLSEDEIDTLNRLVTIFLENAELRVKERKDLTISYWKQNVNSLLSFQGKDILSGKGTVSNDEAEAKAREEYESFDARRKQLDAIQADQDDIKELEEWSKSNK